MKREGDRECVCEREHVCHFERGKCVCVCVSESEREREKE